MRDDGIFGGVLAVLALQFVVMSFMAFGGANAVVPEIHRQAVEVFGWMDDRTFTDFLAMAQVAPGPNVMLVTLVGYHVAGLAGALVATFAMCGPTAVLASFLARAWDRFKDRPWRIIVQAGLVPISVGLVAASSTLLVRLTAQSADGRRDHGGDRIGRVVHPAQSAVAVRGSDRAGAAGLGLNGAGRVRTQNAAG